MSIIRQIVENEFEAFIEDLIGELENRLQKKFADLIEQIKELEEEKRCLTDRLNDAKNCIATQEKEINRLNSVLAKKITVAVVGDAT